MSDGYETGEFEEDGALDERTELISWLVHRIESALNHPQFCGVDLFCVRANIAMLATVIGNHGGEYLIRRAKVKDWKTRMDQVFTNESMRGFTGWPEHVWLEWQNGCHATVQKLFCVVEE